jgi:hypothetical protein
MLVLGGGQACLRKYDMLPDYCIRRDRTVESPVNGLWGFNHVAVPDMVDGAGVVRDKTNKVVVTNGQLEFWRGAGNPSVPGTWRLVKGFVSA